jgi:hypothetical protein
MVFVGIVIFGIINKMYDQNRLEIIENIGLLHHSYYTYVREE